MIDVLDRLILLGRVAKDLAALAFAVSVLIVVWKVCVLT